MDAACRLATGRSIGYFRMRCEHVGGIESQRKFGAEIARVARRGYFVTTPNKFFPIEPHTLLPLYQFLPERWQRKVARISPY